MPILPSQLNTPPVAANTFEFALVMGGTVSAGAYTAGAVDFLVEALDAFETQKRIDNQPYHQVVLKVVAGTSGGAVSAAIAARGLAFDFPPIWYGGQPAPGSAVNPFYDTWVNQLDIAGMLTTTDIVNNNLPSLLNSVVIDGAAAAIEVYTGTPRAAPRAWLGAPLKVVLTHTNLSGIPFELDFGNGASQRFVEHADYIRYAIVYPGQPDYVPDPFELTLAFAGTKIAQASSWLDLGNFALASSAFPIGFPTRQVERPLAHYEYHIISFTPNQAAPNGYYAIQPNYTALLNTGSATTVGNIRYSTVDGGVANNEPIEIARITLAGLLGENPRASNLANRAVLLIDPFAGETDMAAFAITGIIPSAAATLTATLQQGRYSTADLVLAADPNIYSRYMLAANLGGVSGGNVLATGGLGAFLGFFCIDFRRYDYFLGRKNCQDFLRNVFRQSATNAVFDNWDRNIKANLTDAAGDLPIIPLFGQAAIAETLAPWPVDKLNPESLRAGIETRYKAIVEAALPDSFWAHLAGAVGGLLTEKAGADYAIGKITDALKASKLTSQS